MVGGMTTPAAGRGRGALRTAVVGLMLTLLLAAGTGVASAHVTVNPDTVTAGSYAKLTFRVPTESATASTVSVQVSLPTDHPFPSVSVMQMPGWTATVARTKLDPPVTEGDFRLTDAVNSITWIADDKVGIEPGEFAEFAISVGPVPDVSSMTFPTAQTYSDGSVVRWDQARTQGAAEPEHPAPLLTIGAAGSAASGGAGAQPTVAGTAAGPYRSSAIVAAPDGTARILAVIALVVAAAALLVAVVGVRGRRGATGTDPSRAGDRPRADAGA